MNRFFVVIIFVFCSTAANAYFYDGNALHQRCKSNRSFLAGYVSGMFDKAEAANEAVFGIWKNLLNKKLASGVVTEVTKEIGATMDKVHDYCVPANITVGQTADLFCKYLDDHPESRHLTGSVLFNQALGGAWKCR